ncbi:MAG TPA: hypothetical protein VMU57_09295, partial [Edaphobacter sp.]|nr:hypothetical protein [Edaphobacter sp.]
SLGTAGLHIDVVRAPEQVAEVVELLQSHQTLSLGCVDGRNIWLADLDALNKVVASVTSKIGAERLQLAPSCSLLHVPYDTADEDKLDPRVLSWLSFAQQKVEELVQLAKGPELAAAAFAENRRRHEDRRAAESSTNKSVREQLTKLSEGDFRRRSPYKQRVLVQRQELGLPLLPTTTIGSFPQTQEVRKQRAAHKKGAITDAEYNDFLKQKTEECIREQEQIGLDVLVHGEFERNDMVEYRGSLKRNARPGRNGSFALRHCQDACFEYFGQPSFTRYVQSGSPDCLLLAVFHGRIEGLGRKRPRSRSNFIAHSVPSSSSHRCARPLGHVYAGCRAFERR